MKQLLSVLNSDAVNRQNQVFTAGSLVHALSQRWDVGVPMHISHDMTRVAGWARPTTVYFEPGLTRLAGVNLIYETEVERLAIETAQKEYILRNQQETCRPEIVDQLKRKLSKKLIGDEIAVETACVSLKGKDLAVRAFPEVFAMADRDNLIPISALNYIKWGCSKRMD